MKTEPSNTAGALPGDFTELRRLWQIDATTLDRLKGLRPIIEKALSRLDEHFYEPLFTEAPIRHLMRDKAVRQRAIDAMAHHLRNLLSGELADETLLRAALVGKRHQALGVGEQYMLVASQHLLDRLIETIIEEKAPEPAKAIEAVVRVVRLGVSITMRAQAEAAADVLAASEVGRETGRLRKSLKALEGLAFVDGLSGLFNRRYFNQALAATIAHGLRHAEPLCLIMADIDRFKAVNDAHGHPAGDCVLQTLAMLMADVVRQDDVLTRFGGEEFAIILPETSIDEATRCAERIRAAVEALSVPIQHGAPLHVTLSLGVAGFIGSETAEELIANADAALYRAKQSGRNRVEQAGEDAAPMTLLSSAS